MTVNYNGKAFLKDLFESLMDLDYPEEKIEIILVDNASSDDSIPYVRKHFPKIRILPSDKNRGYAGGNNLGIKKASHPYVALINNDTVVDRKWLSQLTDAISAQEKIMAAGSKVLFFFEYVILELSGTCPFRISKIHTQKEGADAYKKHFAQESIKIKGARLGRDPNGCLLYDFDAHGRICVPVLAGPGEQSFSFTKETGADIKITHAGQGLAFTKKQDEIHVALGSGLLSERFRLINSAGIEINAGFYSRDRGYEEIDQGQFDKGEDLFGLSGSSLLIDKRLFGQIGYFDETFFTYYEDIDFFYRARLQGAKMRYCPGSIAYHYHCGTGKEWSSSFTYHVLRNRLLMIYKNSPFKAFLKNTLAFYAAALYHLLGVGKARIRGNRLDRPDIKIRMRLLLELPYFFLIKTPQRFHSRRGRKMEDSLISNWFREF